jgi:hypothetical protein
MSFKEGFKELAMNWNYIKILFIYLFLSGSNNALGTIYANLANDFGYTLLDVSISCLCSITGGVIFIFVVGVLLDKYQNYK